MSDYIYACPNGGKCRQIELAKSGIDVPDNHYGMKIAERITAFGTPTFIYYVNCTGCKRPVSPSEAVKLNKFLGNKIPEIPIDEDLLKALDEF